MENSKPYFKALGILHILNDGYLVTLPLLYPFISKELGFDLAQVGFLGSIQGFIPMILAIPAAYFASKYGGFKVINCALIIYALAYMLMVTASSYLIFVLLIILSSIGFALFHPVAFALVARLSTKEKLGTNMGNFTAIGDVGRTLISVVVPFVAVYIGWRTSSLILGILALLVLAYVYFALAVHNYKVDAKEKKISSFASMKELLKSKSFVLVNIAAGLDGFASNPLSIFLPFLLITKGIDVQFLGIFASAFFVGIIVGKLVLGRLADKLGEKKAFTINEWLMAVFIFVLGMTTNIFLIVISAFVVGALTKGTVPVLMSMLKRSIGNSDLNEEAFAISGVVSGLSSVISGVVMGFVAKIYGVEYAFYLAAIIVIIATIPAMFVKADKLD
jgi:MFS family permease